MYVCIWYILHLSLKHWWIRIIVLSYDNIIFLSSVWNSQKAMIVHIEYLSHYIPVPELNQVTNFHVKYSNSYINCQVPTVAILLIRPNSWWLKRFTIVNSFPLCKCAPLLSVNLSVVRNKSLFHQVSVAFFFLSLLVTPKKSILLQWAKHFYLSQNSFPNYLHFHANVSVHSSISSAVSEETCVGDTFSEPSMAEVNALLRREFSRSKPHGVHGGLRL